MLSPIQTERCETRPLLLLTTKGSCPRSSINAVGSVLIGAQQAIHPMRIAKRLPLQMLLCNRRRFIVWAFILSSPPRPKQIGNEALPFSCSQATGYCRATRKPRPAGTRHCDAAPVIHQSRCQPVRSENQPPPVRPRQRQKFRSGCPAPFRAQERK